MVEGRIPTMDKAIQHELYRKISLIRYVELKIVEVYMSDIMQCPVHLSVGQESIAAAVCAHLRPGDPKIGTHRSHALYLANGGSLEGLFGELLGRVCGCSGGLGGSMHLVDLQHGLSGTTSIVGGALPIVVGLGMTLNSPDLAMVLFGDGAADQGVFAESLNFAQLKKLPVLFVCENNRYSVYTPHRSRRVVRPAVVAKAFGIHTADVPIEIANDVFALYELLAEPIKAVREGCVPAFIECQTVRRYDHNGIRDDIQLGVRDSSEAELFEAYCPIKMARLKLPQVQADAIDAEVKARIESAYQKALASEPTLMQYQHVLVEPNIGQEASTGPRFRRSHGRGDHNWSGRRYESWWTTACCGSPAK